MPSHFTTRNLYLGNEQILAKHRQLGGIVKIQLASSCPEQLLSTLVEWDLPISTPSTRIHSELSITSRSIQVVLSVGNIPCQAHQPYDKSIIYLREECRANVHVMFKFVATCHLQCMYLVHDVRLITSRSLKLSAGKAGNLLKCWRQSFLKDSAKRIVFRPKSQKHAQRDGRWWGSVSRANSGWSLLLAKEPLHYTIYRLNVCHIINFGWATD